MKNWNKKAQLSYKISNSYSSFFLHWIWNSERNRRVSQNSTFINVTIKMQISWVPLRKLTRNFSTFHPFSTLSALSIGWEDFLGVGILLKYIRYKFSLQTMEQRDHVRDFRIWIHRCINYKSAQQIFMKFTQL